MSREYLLNQLQIARNEISNLRHQMTSLKFMHLKEVSNIETTLKNFKCVQCTAKDKQPEQIPKDQEEGTLFRPIGFIETIFQNKRAIPRQSSLSPTLTGIVHLDKLLLGNPQHALMGLEEYSHMWIIYHFHSTGGSGTVPTKVAPPRLRGERTGVFSTRAPRRPCPIGLSLVQIDKVEGNTVMFTGVDMVNGTPVLDIKPYIPHYDQPSSFGSELEHPSQVAYDKTVPDRPQIEGMQSCNSSSSIIDHSKQTEPEINVLECKDLLQSLSFDDEMPSKEDVHHGTILNEPTNITASTSSILKTERGNPDGQELNTSPQNWQASYSMQSTSQSSQSDGIRVAKWLYNPPATRYNVKFTEDVLERLNQLSGERSELIQETLKTLLAEDPRSTYFKNRYPNSEYGFVIEDLAITCMFDEEADTCEVLLVESAAEM